MKISDPLERLEKAASRAGKKWVTSEHRTLYEPAKMNPKQFITVSVNVQLRSVAEAWASNNIEGFDEAIQEAMKLKWYWEPERRERTRVNKAMHVVHGFRMAALPHCKVVKTSTTAR